MEPRVATKVRKPGFEIEKPPPVETEVTVMLNIPSVVIVGTLEKSPARFAAALANRAASPRGLYRTLIHVATQRCAL